MVPTYSSKLEEKHKVGAQRHEHIWQCYQCSQDQYTTDEILVDQMQ